MSTGPRGTVPVIEVKTSEELKGEKYARYITQHSRLPKQIIVDKKIYSLTYSYLHDTVDRYYLSYETALDHPKKKVYMFWEEGNMYEPVLKAYRKLYEDTK